MGNVGDSTENNNIINRSILIPNDLSSTATFLASYQINLVISMIKRETLPYTLTIIMKKFAAMPYHRKLDKKKEERYYTCL